MCSESTMVNITVTIDQQAETQLERAYIQTQTYHLEPAEQK